MKLIFMWLFIVQWVQYFNHKKIWTDWHVQCSVFKFNWFADHHKMCNRWETLNGTTNGRRQKRYVRNNGRKTMDKQLLSSHLLLFFLKKFAYFFEMDPKKKVEEDPFSMKQKMILSLPSCTNYKGKIQKDPQKKWKQWNEFDDWSIFHYFLWYSIFNCILMPFHLLVLFRRSFCIIRTNHYYYECI